ncbi:MAG: hypothetical protein JW727_04345 [Candidatus Aenigmarchaeota archaeon]|nr:hypothetical protein [Candidatus Aenigmarchaeota archaeon]
MAERKFYDLNIASGIDRVQAIKRAEELELGGICLTHCYKGESELEEYLKKIEELRSNAKLEIISGVMLNGEGMEAIAKKLRRKVDLILAYGGNYHINRLACSSDYIDLLCHPERGRRDCGLDHVCCREAHDHNTVIEVNFGQILNSSGGKRVREIYLLKEIVRLCLKSKCPFVVNSGAKTVQGMRGGRELSALSCVLGAQIYPSIVSNSDLPEQLVKMNREKTVQPLSGVYVDYEGQA